MEIPPTYEEAQNPNIWAMVAGKVASYITPQDLVRLCLVSKHLNIVFNPLLWRRPTDIIVPSRFKAFHKHILSCRVETSKMVDTLDFRPGNGLQRIRKDYGEDWFRSYSDLVRYPELRFLILHHETCQALPRRVSFVEEPQSPWDFLQEDQQLPSDLLPKLKNIIFSAANCPQVKHEVILRMPFCSTTQYLDLSYNDLAGFHGLATSELLPRLRILKLRGTKLSDTNLKTLGEGMKGSLWSLDIRDNSLTPNCIPILNEYFGFTGSGLKGDNDVRTRFFYGDWKLFERPPAGWLFHELEHINPDHPALLNNASDNDSQTKDFWASKRYKVDPPAYVPPNQADLTVFSGASRRSKSYRRLIGESLKLRPDTADEIIDWYRDHPNALNNYPHDSDQEIIAYQTGLTHLYLSGNKFPAKSAIGAVETDKVEQSLPYMLLQMSSRLQLLDCDNLYESLEPMEINPFYVPHKLQYKLCGRDITYLGYCRDLPYNLEVLRIHHSFITQTVYIPKNIRGYGRERIEREDAESNSPQCICYTPNQNPKLRELTLTDVPHKSLGRLSDRLIHLIHTAAEQEIRLKEIKNSPEFSTQRSPPLFSGLRVLKLEFRQENNAISSSSVTGDADAEVFMAESEKDFSFFDEEDHEEEVEEKRKREKMDDLVDVVDQLTKYRNNTLSGKIPSPYWSGTLELYFKGSESQPINLPGVLMSARSSSALWNGVSGNDLADGLRSLDITTSRDPTQE